MDSTRMPLEVRVSDKTIAEIYRAQDLFGGYPRSEAVGKFNDREIWDEMRWKVAGAQGPQRQTAPRLARLLASVTISGIVFLSAPALQ